MTQCTPTRWMWTRTHLTCTLTPSSLDSTSTASLFPKRENISVSTTLSLSLSLSLSLCVCVFLSLSIQTSLLYKCQIRETVFQKKSIQCYLSRYIFDTCRSHAGAQRKIRKEIDRVKIGEKIISNF